MIEAMQGAPVVGRVPRYRVTCERCGRCAAEATAHYEDYIDATCDGCGACAWEWTDVRLLAAARAESSTGEG